MSSNLYTVGCLFLPSDACGDSVRTFEEAYKSVHVHIDYSLHKTPKILPFIVRFYDTASFSPVIGSHSVKRKVSIFAN